MRIRLLARLATLRAARTARRITPDQHMVPLASSIADAISRPKPQDAPLKHLVYNCNGIRTLHTSGNLNRLLARHQPDVVALTEIKIGTKRLGKLTSLHSSLRALGYTHCYWHPMTTGHGGLHGTAMFFKQEPLRVLCGWTHEDTADDEGRVMTAIFGTHVLINTYVPCSTWPLKRIDQVKAMEKNQKRRDFDIALQRHCEFLQASLGKPIIHVGDLNVTASDEDFTFRRAFVHEYPGLKPWERTAFHTRNERLRLRDVWRHFHPTASDDDLTHFENEREWVKGRGQRLDYVLAPDELLNPEDETKDIHISSIETDQTALGSDHKPIVFTLENARTPATEVTENAPRSLPLAPLKAQTARPPGAKDRTVLPDLRDMPTMPCLAQATAALPSGIASLAEYDVLEYPACISNPQDAAFDDFVDYAGDGRSMTSCASITDHRQAEIAELRSCSSSTQTVPTSDVCVSPDPLETIRALWDSGASYTTLSRQGLVALHRAGVDCPTRAAGPDAPSFVLADGRVKRPSAKIFVPIYFDGVRMYYNRLG